MSALLQVRPVEMIADTEETFQEALVDLAVLVGLEDLEAMAAMATDMIQVTEGLADSEDLEALVDLADQEDPEGQDLYRAHSVDFSIHQAFGSAEDVAGSYVSMTTTVRHRTRTTTASTQK